MEQRQLNIPVLFTVYLLCPVFCHPESYKNSTIWAYIKRGNSESASDDTCYMSINKTSAMYLQHAIETYEPNFARLELRFRYVHSIEEPYILEPSTSHTEDTIMPYQWVWTYYSQEGFFSYLTWPVDFYIVSLGLLDAKSLKTKQFIVVEVYNRNCSVTIGNPDSIRSIAHALRNLTKEYLLNIKTAFSYSYWCYLAVIPGVKETLGYQFGIYFGYPVEFVRYNCCRTEASKVDHAKISIHCLDHQVEKMWQGTIIPFILGLVAFGFFPLILFSASARLMSIGKKESHAHMIAVTDEGNGEVEHIDDLIFLDGNPPICLTTLIGGMCGLVDKYPIAISRARRFVFVLFGPCVIFCQLYVYYQFAYDTTLDLINHGCPMGYLSMLGGFENSRNNFLPVFGGPFILLFIYYFASCIFLIPPSYPDKVVLDGTIRYSSFGEISPLLLDVETIERYSHLSISKEICGYKCAALFGKAMFFSIMNPKFWCYALEIQCSRFKAVYNRSSVCCQVILCTFFLLVYIPVCVVELALCVLYYGIPVINGICIIVTGYVVWMLKFLRSVDRSRSLFWAVFNNYVTKRLLAFVLSCLFLNYMFSVCTIFIQSFSFLAKILVFSLISVIVYPATSFGYLFFGIVFLYYIFKTFQGFGNGYLVLLADAVEISSQLENNYRNQIIDGTVILDDTVPFEITKLQIRNRIINLSTDQRQAIRESWAGQNQRLVYRNHVAGIPSDLFLYLVKKYLPVHVQITHALLRIFLILTLIYVTISMVVVKPFGPSEGISEMMHVVFIIAIGALPRVLEVAVDNLNYHVKKEIHLREMKSTIDKYWTQLQEGKGNKSSLEKINE